MYVIISSAFSVQDLNMHLVFSVFTYRPTSILAINTARVFS